MITDEEIDRKLARLAERIDRRRAETRAALGEFGCWLADTCRETFDAKLVYFGPASALPAGVQPVLSESPSGKK